MSSQGPTEAKPDLSRSSNTDRKSSKKGKFKGRRFIPTQRFKGETEGLDGHVYDVGTTTQAEQFTETTKKLASYAGRTCKEPQDIHRTIEELKDITVPFPSPRTEILVNTLRNKL